MDVGADIALALALVVPVAVQAATPAEETVETVTLQPDEKKVVTVEATEKTGLGWGHASDGGLNMSELSKKCKNN